MSKQSQHPAGTESVRNARITAKAAISEPPSETVMNEIITKMDVPLHYRSGYQRNGRDQ